MPRLLPCLLALYVGFVMAPAATAQLLREWWTGISGTEIRNLTSDSRFPDDPSGTDHLEAFEAPTD